MKRRIKQLRPFLTRTVPTFLLGERAKGEYAYKKTTFRSSIPENRPSEFEWYREFRVSSLHGIEQSVYFE